MICASVLASGWFALFLAALQHSFGKVEVATAGGQHLLWCVVAVLDEQPSKHLQALRRCGLGYVRAADESHHVTGVGRPSHDVFGGDRDEQDLQEPVRVSWFGHRGLDIALLLVLGEGVIQPREAVGVEDDFGIRDPGGEAARVAVPVHVQGKAVDDVTDADRAGTAGRIVTGVDAPDGLFRS